MGAFSNRATLGATDPARRRNSPPGRRSPTLTTSPRQSPAPQRRTTKPPRRRGHRRQGSGTPYEAYSLIPFVLANPLACSGATLLSDKASPQQKGTLLTFSATSTTCSQPTYRFYVKRPNGIWYLMRDYGSPSFVWNTAAEGVGTYLVDVWVRQNGTQAAYESYQYINFVLGAPVACANATLVSDRVSPQVHGVAVTFTATASGCSQPQFLFYVKRPTGVW